MVAVVSNIAKGEPGAPTRAPVAIDFGDERLPERFWDKVAPCPMSGCWLWTGATINAGYGVLRLFGDQHLAHRVAFFAPHLPVDYEIGTLQLDHLCRQRCCVNPAHLELVSQGENNIRQRLRNGLRHVPDRRPPRPISQGRRGALLADAENIGLREAADRIGCHYDAVFSAWKRLFGARSWAGQQPHVRRQEMDS